MHRTTTSAALLIAAAALSLTGCVTVSPPSGPGAGSEPQIVQAPAHEALERLRHARPPRSKTRRHHPPSKAAPRHESGARPAQPYIPLPRLPLLQPPGQPAMPPGSLPRQPDVCAFGRQFDQWQSDDEKVNLC